MHAIVVNVNIDATRDAEATQMLNNVVVPTAKSLPGFISGQWLRNTEHTKGISFELYESEAAAKAALESRPPGPPPGSPVTLVSVDVMEVAASA